MIQPIEIRKSILQACSASGEGHIPSCFSVVEILAELYGNTLKYRKDDPKWEDRDYFILSKGHASLALYAVLARLDSFQRLNSLTLLNTKAVWVGILIE